MGKKEKVRRMKLEGLHEIKNKYRIRAKKKSKGVVLTAKKRRRVLKACASLSAIFVLLLGVFSLGTALLGGFDPNVVPEGFVTVSYELPDDGSKPSDHSALENIGYMNYRFKNQPNWYAEMHGTTVSFGMGQSVNTIKQYSDGVLIMADVTSGVKNVRRQFCYVGDEVMWREASAGSCKMDSYEDMLKLTYPDDLEEHMSIAAFKEKNGLPGTEMTVYIINEETLDHASEVELVTSGEWDDKEYAQKPVYKQTYYLRAGDPENLGAAAHYANQMAFTGGLLGLPEFNYITVTYTFDSSWQILRAEINESYEANVGITATCTSNFKTDYEYGSQRAKNDDYENFFKNHVGKGINDNVEKPLEALGCIISAFLSKPTDFEIEIEVDGKKTEGVISLDASKLDIASIMKGGSVDIGAALGSVELKAQLGSIYIYLEDSTAYLAIGDMKAKLPVDDLLDMIAGDKKTEETAPVQEVKEREEAPAEEGEEAPALFTMGDLEVEETAGEKIATLVCTLNLKSIGVDLEIPLTFVFKIGEDNTASLKTLDLKLNYQGIDAKVALKGTSKTVPALEDKNSYIDLYPYAQSVYKLIKGGKIDLSLDYYANDDMALTGDIALDFTGDLLVNGALTLQVGESQKTVALAMQNGVVYLNIDGIKISASIEQAKELITGLLPKTTAESDEEESEEVGKLKATLDTVLAGIFDNDLASLFTLGEEEDALTLAVKGTELLKAFGLEFGLGEVKLGIDKASNTIFASAYGASIAVKPLEEEIKLDTADFVDVLSYANALKTLFTGESVTVNVGYENAKLSVSGKLVIALEELAVSGEITVKYGALEKTVGVVYGEDGYIYLTLDKLNAKLGAKDAAALIASLVAGEEGEKEEASVYAILEKVLAVDFGEILSLTANETEENESLDIVLNGNKLLSLLGVDFDLGKVTLNIGAEKVSASALGIAITVAGGGEVKSLGEEEKAAFVDLKPVLDRLPEILEKKALSFGGAITLTTGEDTEIVVSLNRGFVSFAKGVEAYLDLSLAMTEATLNLQIRLDTERVQVALGNLGVELAYNEFSGLGNAVVALYNEVRETLNPVSEKELLPEARTIKELFDLLTSLLSDKEEGEKADLSLDGVLAGLTIKNSEEKNGLLAIELMGATLDLVDAGKGGFVGVLVNYAADGLTVEGDLSVNVYDGKLPAMPKINYLGEKDLEELLDYLVAALNTLSESNLNFTVSGVIGSEDTEKYPDGVQYYLSGELRLYSGKATTVHLELDKKNLWIDADTYLYAKINLDSAVEENKGIYLELYLLDCDEKGAKNGELDLFVSVSLFKEGDSRRNPFTLYAPANEIMPLLSSALAFLGMDSDIVSNYVLAPWLDMQTVAQLKGFGKSILNMINNFTGGEKKEEKETAALNINALVSSLNVSDTALELALDGSLLGRNEPLVVSLAKEKGENGSRLASLAVSGIKGVSLSLGVSYDNNEKITPSFKGSLALNGFAPLIQTIARSTTHRVEGETISGEETKHEYALNEFFYIDGNIVLDINAIGILKEKLNIKVVAFSITIDEDGVWGVNVRFEYDAVKVLGITAINGNTRVDLTGKDNTVYIKRVQTTDADGKTLAKPITIYRAMPLKNFANDLIGQAGFLFNLGDKIASLLNGIDTSGSGAAKEPTDIGTTVNDILNSFVYDKNANGESWTITVNGKALSDALGDIVLAFGSDSEGKLRTLKINAAIATTGISMTVNANLTYHNPCGEMDEGVTDITTDVAQLLVDGMSYKLETVDWTNTVFIEGEFTTVEFILAGNIIKSQDLVISTGNGGDAKGVVYGTLAYPDLSAYPEKGYKAEWVVYYGKDDALPESRQIFARYNPVTYTLTFELKGESVTLEYQYGDESFTLPFGENEKERIVCFTANGEAFYTAADLENLSGDTVLTAVYEKIPYAITFVIGDETIENTLCYGDEIEYPVGSTRTGYTFAGWDITPETVTGNTQITALWTANEYTVTLVSKYAIEGYDWTEVDGNFVTSFAFVYDSKVEIPRNLRETAGDKAFILRGFCTNGEVCYFDYLPNITEDTTFTAQWQELGFDLTFVARDGSKIVLNYHGGEVIPANAIPAIEARDGYTGYWRDGSGTLLGADYTVKGEARFTVYDAPNTYAVTVISEQPYAGFAAADGVYAKTLSYTYDGAAVTLEALNDIHKYWFGGYTENADGTGAKINSVAGILQDTTVYVLWIDNTVTVNICSDIAFAGAEFKAAKNAYVKQYDFNDTYELTNEYLPTVDGYQTLALWHETGSGYERVTNVLDLNGADLWVLWIKNIKVSITDFYTNGMLGGKQYNICGTVEGGDVFGAKSLEIFGANGSVATTAFVDVMGASASDKNGNLSWGKELAITYKDGDSVGTFSVLKQNCSNYAGGWGGKTATYGGAIIIKTFTCGGVTVKTSSGSFVSLDTYTVTYQDENGREVGKVDGVRIACPFPYVKDSVSYEFDSSVYCDTIAAENEIAVPEKEGYDGAWAHEEIRGSVVIKPVYTAKASD